MTESHKRLFIVSIAVIAVSTVSIIDAFKSKKATHTLATYQSSIKLLQPLTRIRINEVKESPDRNLNRRQQRDYEAN